MDIKTIDARGLSCPQPVMMTMEALEENNHIYVLVDNETALFNVTRLAETKGFKVRHEEDGEDFKIEIM